MMCVVVCGKQAGICMYVCMYVRTYDCDGIGGIGE